MDSNGTLPVEIEHPLGLKFHLRLPPEEIELFRSDQSYATEVLNKYWHLYQNGLVSAAGTNEVEEETEESINQIENTETDIQSEPEQMSLTKTRIRSFTSEDEEQLIRLVSERPPLYDFRLPLKERGRAIVRDLWEEIANELNVDITPEALARKWKHIRDSFIRVRSNINKKMSSGASSEEKLAAERIRKNHKHYDLLLFLDDTLTTRRTSTNLTGDLEGEEETRSYRTTTPSFSRPPSRTRSVGDATSSLSEQDAAFIRAIENMPKTTPIQSFCMRISHGLQKLPPRISNQLQMEFLQKLTDMENQYLYSDNPV